MKKGLTLICILAALIAMIVLAGHAGSRSRVGVQVEKLYPHLIRSSVLASGKIAYGEKVTLTSELLGIVNAIHVTEGGIVKKSDLVLEIRDQEYVAAVDQNRAAVRIREAAIDRAKLNVERLAHQWQRNKQLFEQKLISKDAYETVALDFDLAKVDLKSAQASLAQSKAQLEEAEKVLSKTHIHSPIDGVVTSLDIKKGETAIPSVGGIPGSTLMLIANPDSVYTEVNVDEADVGNVEIGDEADVVAVAFPNNPIHGVLESMATSAKVAEGRQGLSFSVKIRLNRSADVQLRPGMSCRVEIFTHTKAKVLAAPIQSILVEEDRKANKSNHFLFLNQNNAANKVPVEVGVSDDNYQEITSGASSGDEVVVGPDKALQSLHQGDALSIVQSGVAAK
jgi:HlyD family secretion protein